MSKLSARECINTRKSNSTGNNDNNSIPDSSNILLAKLIVARSPMFKSSCHVVCCTFVVSACCLDFNTFPIGKLKPVRHPSSLSARPWQALLGCHCCQPHPSRVTKR